MLFPASLGEALSFPVSMDDPRGLPSPPASAQPTLCRLCNPSEEMPLWFVCGAHPIPTETNNPCGQSAPPSDGEGYPCGMPPPDKSPLTLCQRWSGTEERPMWSVCGVTLLATSETNDPCGQSAPPSDVEGYPCGTPLPDKSQLTLCQRCSGTEERPMWSTCGVTPLHTSETYDPCGQTAPSSDGEGYPCGTPSLPTITS